MKSISKMLLLATTLSLLMMGPLYATSPQKSTFILINGEEPVCTPTFQCALSASGVQYMLMSRSSGHTLTIFNMDDHDTVCDVISNSGEEVVDLYYKVNTVLTCSR